MQGNIHSRGKVCVIRNRFYSCCKTKTQTTKHKPKTREKNWLRNEGGEKVKKASPLHLRNIKYMLQLEGESQTEEIPRAIILV